MNFFPAGAMIHIVKFIPPNSNSNSNSYLNMLQNNKPVKCSIITQINIYHLQPQISTAGDTDWMVALYYREDSWFRADSHSRDVIIHSPVVGIRMSNLSALPVTIVFHKNYVSQ